MGNEERSEVRWGLIVAGILLMAFGFLAILSIGAPFFFIGVVVLVAGVTGVHRTNPGVFWPLLLAMVAFFTAYVLVAPLSCTSWAVEELGSGASGQASSGTQCSNLIGIDYSGGISYDPPLWPAGLAALGAAMITGVGARQIISRR